MGGIYSSGTVKNCILAYNNTVDQTYGPNKAVNDVYYTCIEDREWTREGNITGDPKFVDVDSYNFV